MELAGAQRCFQYLQEKGIKVSTKAIRRHLYWCVLSTKQGFGNLIVAKWKSVVRHIANLHTDHPEPLYKSCPHGPIEPREWIKQGNHCTTISGLCYMSHFRQI